MLTVLNVFGRPTGLKFEHDGKSTVLFFADHKAPFDEVMRDAAVADAKYQEELEAKLKEQFELVAAQDAENKALNARIAQLVEESGKNFQLYVDVIEENKILVAHRDQLKGALEEKLDVIQSWMSEKNALLAHNLSLSNENKRMSGRILDMLNRECHDKLEREKLVESNSVLSQTNSALAEKWKNKKQDIIFSDREEEFNRELVVELLKLGRSAHESLLEAKYVVDKMREPSPETTA